MSSLLFLSSCQQQQSAAAEEKANEEKTVLPEVGINKDSLLLNFSKQILISLKNKDLHSLIKFIHPDSGIRLSPYAYISTTDKRFTRQTFLKAVESSTVIEWGITSGSGETIAMPVTGYFARYVYDVDFLQAEKIVVNQFLGSGNSLNNLLQFYPDTDFTESYFSGFDKKYGGMDWRTLRLVYKQIQDQFYLVGIVHDEWTP